MAQWVNAGWPLPLPPGSRFASYSNEDIDFNANLTGAATTRWHSFYLPLPGSIDKLTQTISVHCIDFIYQDNSFPRDDDPQQLQVYISSRGENPVATSNAIASDTNDPFWKAQIDGGFTFGTALYQPTDASLAGPFQWVMDVIRNVRWYPPASLDQMRPTHIHFNNQSVSIDPATQDETAVDFTKFEQVIVKPWYTVRNMTAAEMDQRQNASTQFAILNA